MLTHCPSCQQKLPFTSEQISRLEHALAQLAPGKLLTMKCPLCRTALSLEKSGLPPQKTRLPGTAATAAKSRLAASRPL